MQGSEKFDFCVTLNSVRMEDSESYEATLEAIFVVNGSNVSSITLNVTGIS